jgi:hypothetical protein
MSRDLPLDLALSDAKSRGSHCGSVVNKSYLQKWRELMNVENLKETLKKLQTNLESNGKVDAELKDLLQVLDKDIHQLLGQEASAAENASGLAERAQLISVKFAAQHPHLEPLLRELVDILTGMGV